MFFDTGAGRIRITHKTRADLFHDLSARFAAGRGFALATLNLDHLVKLRQNPAFASAYAAQDAVVADGNPIVLLSHLAGEPAELLPGSDLVLPLCRLAAEHGLPVSLFGATEAALAQAQSVIAASVPGFIPGLTIAPAMGFDPSGPEADSALERLAGLGPGLCLIALGAPKQEIFAARGRAIAPQCGFASVGAGLEFLSGHQRRAPAWMRRFALEWLWRALSAPGRLGPRYLACAAILPGQMIKALAQRGAKPS